MGLGHVAVTKNTPHAWDEAPNCVKEQRVTTAKQRLKLGIKSLEGLMALWLGLA